MELANDVKPVRYLHSSKKFLTCDDGERTMWAHLKIETNAGRFKIYTRRELRFCSPYTKTMKKRLLVSTPILLFILLISVFSANLFAEYLKYSNLDGPEDIPVDLQALEEYNNSEHSTQPREIEQAAGPTLITFDDVPWNGSAIAISPNRYPGVSFYAPYSNSYTFVRGNFGSSYSFPNHLLVGALNGYSVNTQSPLIIEFSQKMQDVSLYVNQGGCLSSAVDIYENYSFLRSIYVSLNANPYDGWTRLDFNSNSRKITKLAIFYNCSLQYEVV